MSQDRRYAQDELQGQKMLRVVGKGWIERCKIHSQKPFQQIDNKYNEPGFGAQNTESIGCSRISAPVFPYIRIKEYLSNPYRCRNGSDQIGSYDDGDVNQFQHAFYFCL